MFVFIFIFIFLFCFCFCLNIITQQLNDTERVLHDCSSWRCPFPVFACEYVFEPSPMSMSSSLRLWVCLRVFAYEYVFEYVFESSPMSMSSSMSSSLRLWLCLRVFVCEYVFEYVFESLPISMPPSLRLWVYLRAFACRSSFWSYPASTLGQKRKRKNNPILTTPKPSRKLGGRLEYIEQI